MQSMLRWNAVLLMVLVFGLTVEAEVPATKKPTAPPDNASLDAAIHRVFRDIINKGAEQYNNGDRIGCYRHYEHALLAVRPILGHQPQLQQSIDAALVEASQEPQQHERAFILRRVIDQMRASLKPESVVGTKVEEKPKPAPPEKKAAIAPAVEKRPEPTATPVKEPAPAAPKKKPLEKKIEKRAG